MNDLPFDDGTTERIVNSLCNKLLYIFTTTLLGNWFLQIHYAAQGHGLSCKTFGTLGPSRWEAPTKDERLRVTQSNSPSKPQGLRVHLSREPKNIERPPGIKGPENPTRQLLPIMSTRCCSGDGEGRKHQEGGGGSRSKTKLWVAKLYVKDCAWQRKMVCVTKLCVKEGVSKMVCQRWWVTMWCAKEGVWQSGV